MMQQSVGQDHIGLPPQAPQMAQMTQQQGQMMYCPVRLVYDPATSMVMQQGEQIQQQNQNMFVNQPPWARPVQNQVIYVQQIGSNFVPIQQMDPNIYIQQNPYSGMHQMVQNIQNIPQGQMRQVMGSVPTNMMPNFGLNMQGITIDQATGQIMQNYGYIQANPEVNIANNIVNANAVHDENRQMVTNQAIAHNVQNQDVQTQLYRQMITQMNQQQNLVRPQAPLTIGQFQNLQNMQTIQQQAAVNVAQMGQNVGANNQMPTNNSGNISQATTNASQVSHNVGGNVRQNLSANVAPNLQSNVGQITNRASTNMNVIQNQSNIPVNTTAVRPNTETNMVTNIGQNLPQIRQVVSPQTINIMARNAQQNLANATERSIANNVNNINTVLYSAVRNGQPYTYRAIQPKPNVNVRMNFMPRAGPLPMVRKSVATNINSAIPSKMDTSLSTASTQIRPAIRHQSPLPLTSIKIEQDNSTINRKRKSESPDEIQKKVSNYGSITVKTKVIDRIKAKYGQTSQHTSEMGTNTSPVHKPIVKTENPQPMLQINPMETKIKDELGKPTEIRPNFTNTETDIKKISNVVIAKETTDSKNVSQQTDPQTLVRKTVFPQARGRLLDDKVTAISKLDNTNINPGNKIAQIEFKTTEPEIKSEADKNINLETKIAHDKPSNIINEKINAKPLGECIKKLSEDSNKIVENKNDLCSEQNKASKEVLLDNQETIRLTKKTEDMSETNKDIALGSLANVNTELKKENDIENIVSNTKANTEPTNDIKMETTETETVTDFTGVIRDKKIEMKEYKNISISEMTGKEIHIVDGNIHKKERDYVLTHVLDGYVIQESNVPFAIRKPLKEKTINAVTDENQEPGVKKDEIKDKIYDLSQLHINEQKEKDRKEKEDEKNLQEKEKECEAKEEKEDDNVVEKDDPFRCLTFNVVKSWTVDELAGHLAKHNWTETVSILQEHEIDGESLLLVTRSQLVTIGISEEHADAICEFVQKN